MLCARAASGTGRAAPDGKAAVCRLPVPLPFSICRGALRCARGRRRAAARGAGPQRRLARGGPAARRALFHPAKPTRGFHKGKKGLLPAKPHNEAVKLASPALRPVNGRLAAPAGAFPFPGGGRRQPALPRAEAEAFRGPPLRAQQAASEMKKAPPAKARGRRIPLLLQPGHCAFAPAVFSPALCAPARVQARAGGRACPEAPAPSRPCAASPSCCNTCHTPQSHTPRGSAAG